MNTYLKKNEMTNLFYLQRPFSFQYTYIYKKTDFIFNRILREFLVIFILRE